MRASIRPGAVQSLPDARAILTELTNRQVVLNLGGARHDPIDPIGRLLFNVLAMVAEFESDLIRMRTREGLAVARAKGRLKGLIADEGVELVAGSVAGVVSRSSRMGVLTLPDRKTSTCLTLPSPALT